MKRTATLGLALVLVGLALALGFWPLTSVSGAELLASQQAGQNGEYAGYAPGARITIHERVLDRQSVTFLGSTFTWIELDDGNPDQATLIYVVGDATGVVSPRDVIYASAVLKAVPSLSFYYWEVATPADVHQSWPVDAVFYGIMAAGVAVLAYAALKKP